MRRMRQDHLRKDRGRATASPLPLPSMTAKEGAQRVHPSKSGSGRPFRHDLTRLQWYPCPATVHTMGAVRRDPRRGGIPGARRPPRFSPSPTPGGAAANTGKRTISETIRGRSVFSCGAAPSEKVFYGRKTYTARGNISGRSASICGVGAGRYSSCSDSSEQCGKPLQPHGSRSGHNQQTDKTTSADPCPRWGNTRNVSGFHHTAGADPDLGQNPAEGLYRFSRTGYYTGSGSCDPCQCWTGLEKQGG